MNYLELVSILVDAIAHFVVNIQPKVPTLPKVGTLPLCSPLNPLPYTPCENFNAQIK